MNKNGNSKFRLILIILAIVCIILAVVSFIFRDTLQSRMAIEYPLESSATEQSYDSSVAVSDDPTYEVNLDGGDWADVVINRKHANTSTYTGETVTLSDIPVDSRIAGALQTMIADAAKDDINLVLVTGYRTTEEQDKYYEEAVAANIKSGMTEKDAEDPLKIAEDPSEYSEYCTGLGVDVVSEDYQKKDTGFGDTEAYKWLQENCGKYGFVIRYPEDKTSSTGICFRPWHLRFVGQTRGEYIMENDMTLESFFGIKG